MLTVVPYERFDAWKRCHELALSVYQVTKLFPPDERYGLRARARRAAVSAPANIAEGASERGRREFARHLDIALGSLGELTYVLELSRDIGLIEFDDWERLDEMRERASIVT
ncbi:MAG: four helix bundle protein [Gemmatimonadota bacterium]|nr:MAG: four helix bundle protein [Gemmatimonadota bacterium]